MRIFRIPVVFAAIFVAVAAYAGVSVPPTLSLSASLERLDCATMLTAIHSTMDINPSIEAESVFAPSSQDKHIPEESTVFFESVFEGAHGGKRHLLRKTGERWVSWHTSTKMGFDPQGDPRAMIDVLGEKAAAFFGFKMISEDLMTIPDATEFQGALAKINSYLIEHNEEPIALNYYETVNNDDVKVAEYVGRFSEFLGIPIAPSGNHLLHDMGLHVAGIFLPRDLLMMKAETIVYIEKFIAFLEKKFAGNETKLKAVKYFAYVLRMHQTVKIDVASAYPLVSIIELLRDPTSEYGNANFRHTVNTLTNDSRDPAEFTAAAVHGFYVFQNFIKTQDFQGEFSFSTPQKAQTHQAAITEKELTAAFNEFKPIAPIDPALTHAFHQTASDETKDKRCKEMSRRRMVIRDAALALGK